MSKRYIDADGIQYTMLYKENWITNTGVEKQGVWKDDIDKMPTADVRENVRGEWIDRGKDMTIRWQCSECGRRDTHIYNFCPDCGADMRGEKDA